MSFFEPHPRPDPTIRSVPDHPSGLRLRVELTDSSPLIWRSIEVSDDVYLDTFHLLLQAAMGWTNSHLHQFFQGENLSGPHFLTDFDLDEGQTGISEGDIQLSQVLAEPGDTLGYLYDFGDDWYHTITVEEVLSEVPELPRCIDGQRACPPEDSGGRQVFEPDSMKQWLPEDWHPDTFDAEELTTAMHQVLAGPTQVAIELSELLEELRGRGGAVAEKLLKQPAWSQHVPGEVSLSREMLSPFITFLEVVGDGVKLTATKRLPPAVVKQYAQASGISGWWVHAITTEENTIPVADIHNIARTLGLVYTRNGKESPTVAARKLGEDPAAWMDYLANKLPLGRGDLDRHAGWMTLLVAGADEEFDEWMTLIKAALADLGWRTTENQLQSSPNPSNPTSRVLRLLVRGLENTYRVNPDNPLNSMQWEENRRAVAALARQSVLRLT